MLDIEGSESQVIFRDYVGIEPEQRRDVALKFVSVMVRAVQARDGLPISEPEEAFNEVFYEGIVSDFSKPGVLAAEMFLGGATVGFSLGYDSVAAVSLFRPHESSAAFYISQFMVDPKHHSSGAAGLLLGYVLSRLRQEYSYNEVYLLTRADNNDRARKFYEKYGFTVTGHRTTLVEDGPLYDEFNLILGTDDRQ